MALPQSPGQIGQQTSPSPQNSTQWLDVLTNLIGQAESTSDRIAVMEQCKKATGDELGHVRLWRLYGDWCWLLYKVSHNVNGVYAECTLDDGVARQPWSQEDAVIGQVVFQWAGMMDVWQQGVKATQWHINDSHVVWDPYMELLLYDLSISPSDDKIQSVKAVFDDRLRQPHATRDNTFQSFSTFISTYDQANYERIMTDTNAKTQRAKQEYDLRRDREQALTRAEEAHDDEEFYRTMLEYLEWEESQQRKKKATPFTRELYYALCERATLRFPTSPEFWLDRIVALLARNETSEVLLQVAERATMHCPGSGVLWQKRLYCLEACEKDFQEIADVKHTATSTGLLEDVGNMQEIILVEFAWCSYLRRRAFAVGATEEDLDVAEMALRSAIENVWTVGHKKYGKAFKGDPEFRMERIYLKFLAQAGRFDEARKEFRKLESTHGDNHYFWERWYLFEMMVYDSRFDHESRANKDGLGPPRYATEALQRAIKRPNLDYPEKVIDMYVHHCAQHESARKLLEAQVETRRLLKNVAKKREKQYAEAAAAQQLAMLSQVPGPSETQQESLNSGAKRKRETEAEEANGTKKGRQDSGANDITMSHASASATSQVKRDRENTMVVVRHLPTDVNEASIKRFFRDCGEILSTTIVPDKGEAVATIEFASKEDVLTAQTKSMKSFQGRPLEITVGTGTTVYVTNYPPTADEKWIRGLFSKYGDIVSVRFPLLKYNSHRRFCYVQFLTGEQAQASTKLDGTAAEKGIVMSVGISNPNAKKNRTSALDEGREIYLGNVERSAREADVKQLVMPFGSVESVRIPTNMKGQSKGAAFVVLRTKEGAQAALALNNTDFKGRVLKANVSEARAQKQSTLVVDHKGASASPAPSASAGDLSMPDACVGSPTPSTDATYVTTTAGSNSTTRSHHAQRTLALLNLPDTVNSARIRALCEPHGDLVKITLRPDHGGAFVEFEDESGMGRASMALGGQETDGGAKVEIGSVVELLKSKPFVKTGTTAQHGAHAKVNGDYGSGSSLDKSFLAPPKPVARPTQSGGMKKRGGRGGLGFKSAGSRAAAVAGADGGDEEMRNGDGGVIGEGATVPRKGRSQNDFRILLASGGSQARGSDTNGVGDAENTAGGGSKGAAS